MSSDNSLNCGAGGGSTSFTGLRIASVFIIWVCSTFGAVFPIIARRSSFVPVPHSIFEFAKYFGSGVIIATAFIHLLSPAIDELSSPCLGPQWTAYPYPLALALLSAFSIFIVELLAFRIGNAKLKKLGIRHDAHGHGVGALLAHGPEGGSAPALTSGDHSEQQPDVESMRLEKIEKKSNFESSHPPSHSDGSGHGFLTDEGAVAQLIGVAILEFGVILHRSIPKTFEGLGIGSRLAYLDLPRKYRIAPVLAAFLYGITTPIGIAVGLGVRTTYNPGSTHATLVSGVLDALSAGILMYTGFVELLAHEFLFNREMHEASNWKLLYALSCLLFGCGIMALLGKWA
ncbi:ZIP-like iron-zinc transporter [Multifurca ochricompacta]|uniref:ZIP-like iron-zinc transporter n=1 Tax=Multifurca ochricompacta TaxID=376703 RepID=A0AAD4MBH6_9AGAM|nr:ZIP-like iron-zinc transporter [Multifurca ochricompacta]